MDIPEYIERNPAVVIGALLALGALLLVGQRGGGGGGTGGTAKSQFTGTVTELDPRQLKGISYITPDQLRAAQQDLYERIHTEEAQRYVESRPLIPYRGGY